MGVYIVVRVNSDKQSYGVTAVDLPSAWHPTLALTSRLSSSTERTLHCVYTTANNNVETKGLTYCLLYQTQTCEACPMRYAYA